MTKNYVGIVPFWPLKVSDEENYFLNPARAARNQNYSSSLFVYSPKLKHKDTIYKDISLRFFPSVFSLYQNLPGNGVVHCQTLYKPLFYLYWLLLFRPKNWRVIWTPHTSFGNRYPFNLSFNILKFFSFLFKRFNQIIAITRYEEKYFRKLHYNNISYIPLVVNKKRLSLKRSSPAQDSFNLLFVGGDRSVKGLEFVLKTFTILKRLKFNMNLSVLGKVSARFRKRHYDLLSLNSTLHGEVKHFSPHYFTILRNSSCYINNSFYEGSPLAAYEAAAAGLPLCLSDLPTLRSMFGKNALYHNPTKPTQLVKNILYYYYNPQIAQQHIMQNQKTVSALSYSHFKKKFISLLTKISSEA